MRFAGYDMSLSNISLRYSKGLIFIALHVLTRNNLGQVNYPLKVSAKKSITKVNKWDA